MFNKAGEGDKINTALQVHILGRHKITDNLIQMIKSLRNIKFIFIIQSFIVVAAYIYWRLLPRGYEKDVSIGVLFGLMFSVIV